MSPSLCHQKASHFSHLVLKNTKAQNTKCQVRSDHYPINTHSRQCVSCWNWFFQELENIVLWIIVLSKEGVKGKNLRHQCPPCKRKHSMIKLNVVKRRQDLSWTFFALVCQDTFCRRTKAWIFGEVCHFHEFEKCYVHCYTLQSNINSFQKHILGYL